MSKFAQERIGPDAAAPLCQYRQRLFQRPRRFVNIVNGFFNGHAPVRIDFPATGEFAPASVNVRLERGPNTIRLHAPASPLPELDLLDLTLPTGFIQY